MPEKLKGHFESLGESFEVEDPERFVEDYIEGVPETMRKIDSMLYTLRSIDWLEPGLLEDERVLRFWDFVWKVENYISVSDRSWFTKEMREGAYGSILEDVGDGEEPGAVGKWVDQEVEYIRELVARHTHERFSSVEERTSPFDTYTPEGRILSQKKIKDGFRSGVVLAHRINRTARNYHEVFQNVITRGELESQASIVGSGKIGIDASVGPSQSGPYILPDISFWVNHIADEVNFLVPMEDVISTHDFYGREEFHIYPKDKKMARRYNEYRETGDREKLHGFKNTCRLDNATVLLIRTLENEMHINVLLNMLLRDNVKVRGFSVIDFEKEADAGSRLTEFLNRWASHHGIDLYNGFLEEHPMLADKIKRVPFQFTSIHGSAAYDRENEEVFSVS
jgi:hypothetical protein